jgi:SAM-dependent methyltransferase
MHLKIGGDGLTERLGLASGLVPWPLVLTTFGPGFARSCVAATRLGIWDALGAEALTSDELAGRIACDPTGTEVLARALVGFDLLSLRGERFSNTAAARKWLCADGKQSLRDAVLFLGYCHELCFELEDAVRTGQITRLHDREHPPEFWDAYLRGLASFARIAGKEITWRARVPRTATRILDLGGGHGLYSAALCRRIDGLQAEVLDLAEACRVGSELVADEGLSDRVTFRPGDFRTDELGQDHDAVLLFNVLHNATEAEARQLIKRSWDALRPGGQLLIWDARHGGDRLDANAGWNELFFFLISGARAWPEATLSAWCRDAGFAEVATSYLWVAPTVLLRARK